MEKLVTVARNIGNIVNRKTRLSGGGESAAAISKIRFKTTKNLISDDNRYRSNKAYNTFTKK